MIDKNDGTGKKTNGFNDKNYGTITKTDVLYQKQLFYIELQFV